MQEDIKLLKKSLLEANQIASSELLSSMAYINDPMRLIEVVIVPVMKQIGDGWENGSVALSQVYMSGRFIEDYINKILPAGDPKRKYQPKMAITVLEDYHILGKRIVYSMLRASGFELKDYGRTSVDELYNKIQNDDIEVILISTLMLPSALRIKELKKKLDDKNIKVKIIVGGAPFRFDKKLWKEVGAYATASTTDETITLIDSFSEDKI